MDVRKQNSICLFCSYFKGEEIPEYIRVYLYELKRHFEFVWMLTDEKDLTNDSLIFLSENGISLKQYRNEGYDFGMWSKALKEIATENWTEVALVNDSCVLFRELDSVMRTIRQSNWDYAGLVASKQVRWHIQSYFVVMRASVLDTVREYFEKHGIKKGFGQVILDYEVGLSEHLEKRNFRLGAVYGVPGDTILNPSFMEISRMIAAGFPMIKRKLITGSYRKEEIRGLLIRNFNFNPGFYSDQIHKHVPNPIVDIDPMKSTASRLRLFTLISPLLSVPFALLRKLKPSA